MPNCYYISPHAQEKMEERNFTKEEIDRAFWCGRKTSKGDTTEYVFRDLCVVIRDLTIITVLIAY